MGNEESLTIYKLNLPFSLSPFPCSTVTMQHHQMKAVEPQMISSTQHRIPNLSAKKTPRSTTTDVTRIPDSVASINLSEKLMGDVLVASGVTFCVAPFLTVVDKAIVQSAAGSHTLLRSGVESIQNIARNPIQYLKSPTFLLMWGVYAATYSTANSLKTYSEHQEYSEARRRTPDQLGRVSNTGKLGVFLGTTMVNSGCSLLKDQAYARMFGTNSVTTVMPRMTYALWMTRDLSVVGSSFILPDLVSSKLVDDYDMDRRTALSLSQLGLPIATQFIAGPLHFMGLDLYNRNLGDRRWGEAIIDRS